MPLSADTTLINRYRIVRLLGQGGFGAVYEAWDQNFNLPCAVKENLVSSPEAQRQFTQAARILRTLHHPGLPQVIDHFAIAGQGQYLVMDYVEGENLQEMLRSWGKPLPEEVVLPWILQVCDALSYLHSQTLPVIHRDIKPQNIVVTPAGQAMLVDFGIAKTYDANLSTTLGARAITPGYSPPEQYGHSTTDARSDIYALGATLYALLTGKTPPASVDVVSGMTPPPPPVNTLNKDISPQVAAAISRAMQPNRAERFASAADFKAALAVPGVPQSLRAAAAPQNAETLRAAPPSQASQPASAAAPAGASRRGSLARISTRGAIIGILGAFLLCGSLAAGGAVLLRLRPTPTLATPTSTLLATTLSPTPAPKSTDTAQPAPGVLRPSPTLWTPPPSSSDTPLPIPTRTALATTPPAASTSSGLVRPASTATRQSLPSSTPTKSKNRPKPQPYPNPQPATLAPP